MLIGIRPVEGRVNANAFGAEDPPPTREGERADLSRMSLHQRVQRTHHLQERLQRATVRLAEAPQECLWTVVSAHQQRLALRRIATAMGLRAARAVEEIGVRPHTATSDEAAIYPSALVAVLPKVTRCAGKAE